jgi:hypothetical protein
MRIPVAPDDSDSLAGRVVVQPLPPTALLAAASLRGAVPVTSQLLS